MAIPCWKIMPALVTGNTVVFKPASDTPHCATLLVELMAEAGVPPGVVNLVTGTGGEVGDAIVGDPDVSVISFTGSSTTGKAIATKAGGRLKRLSLELGGKNGVVVLADADLDLATDGILWSAFGTTGQRCTAASRVIVERPVVDALLQRLESRARALRLGDGMRDTTDVGPLINGGAVDKVASYIDIGRGEGDLVIGGGRASDGELEHGHFFEPTIFAGVGAMDRIGQEEIFGPVLSIIPVDDYGCGDAGAQPDALRPLVEHLHARREHRVPGDARLRDRHRVRQRRHDRRRDRTCRSAAGRRPATVTARRAASRSTRTPSGSRSTSTSAAGSNVRRSTISRLADGRSPERRDPAVSTRGGRHDRGAAGPSRGPALRVA